VRPGHAADHSPPSSTAVVEEKSYTSTHPLGHTGPVTGSLYLYQHVSGDNFAHPQAASSVLYTTAVNTV